jgi:protein involved in ribonucleotide reduction
MPPGARRVTIKKNASKCGGVAAERGSVWTAAFALASGEVVGRQRGRLLAK